MRTDYRYFKDSWLIERYTTTKGEVPPKFGEKGGYVVVRKDEESVGTFPHNYSWWPDKFLPVTLEGQDYAIYAPTYSSIAVMKLPECEEIYRMPVEWWSVDDCPLAFYAHPYLPGLVFVIWVVWGDEHNDLISYFWLSPDGTIKAKPHGPWVSTRWNSDDPAEKFFEFEDLSYWSGEWDGRLIIKTEERVDFGEVIAEREKLVGPTPTERIYEE